MKRASLALLLLPIASVAQAQAIKNEPPMREFTQEEVNAIAMPDLEFEETDGIRDDYEKYFFFHREETGFDQAYADVTECDALASGISYYRGVDAGQMGAAMAQYGALAGGIGGVIGGMMADAIFGSAERRKQRRMNLRNCMFYKGYDRYGLEKDLWQEFNFEEGNSREEASKREAALLKQAKIASGPKPVRGSVEP